MSPLARLTLEQQKALTALATNAGPPDWSIDRINRVALELDELGLVRFEQRENVRFSSRVLLALTTGRVSALWARAASVTITLTQKGATVAGVEYRRRGKA